MHTSGSFWHWAALLVLVFGSCAPRGEDGTTAHGSADEKVSDGGIAIAGERAGDKKSSLAPGSTLYSYADERGRIHMVGSIDQVPKKYADRILVSDTARARRERLSSDHVVVLDLRRSAAGKPLNYSVVDLSSFKSTGADRGPARTPGQLGRRLVLGWISGFRSAVGLDPEHGPEASVILYSAPWCGFCRKAEAYLKSKRVSFVKRDIESNPAAAMELHRKLAAAGLRGGGIPVLDIRGTLVVGFDKGRINSLLGL